MSKMLVATLALILVAPAALARDTRIKLPIADAMKAAAGRVNADVKLYWGSQAFPKPQKSFGSFTTNKKTNFFNKSDKEGCEWAFLSAILTLQERAVREGGNAVVNIKSVYRGGNFASETEYECGAGAMVGGVAFEGEVVKLP